MSTSSMLIDSSESFGSSEEEHVRHQLHPQWSWEEPVVSEEEAEDEDGDGVLIVPSSNSSRAETHQEDLSMPDSVFTDLPSIHTTGPVENVTLLLGERSQAGDQEPDLLSNSTAGGGINVHATVLIRGTGDQRSIQGQEPSNRRSLPSQWLLFGSLLVALSLVGSTAFLVHDRRQLQARAREAELHRTKAAELEEQVRRLEEERRAEKQAKPQQQRREQRKQYQEFPWESGQNDATIMDNCWAQVQMGECSREATQTVKKQVAALGQSALKTSQTIYNQLQRDAATVADWLQDLSQKSPKDEPIFQRSSSSPPPPPSSDSKNKKSEATSKKQDEDKKSTVENFKTVGKTMLTTVALGAVTVGVFAGIEALFPNANLKDGDSDNDHLYYTSNP